MKNHIEISHLRLMSKDGLDKFMTKNTESKHHDIDILYDLIHLEDEEIETIKKTSKKTSTKDSFNIIIAECICSFFTTIHLINELWKYNNNMKMEYKNKRWYVCLGDERPYKSRSLLYALWEAYVDINDLVERVHQI